MKLDIATYWHKQTQKVSLGLILMGTQQLNLFGNVFRCPFLDRHKNECSTADIYIESIAKEKLFHVFDVL